MGQTIVEKILTAHSRSAARPGAILSVRIDARVARDFGGANVVKNIRNAGLSVAEPERTYFTFDCNPTGSDQKYATNQQYCREFARETGCRVFDIDRGIGTHIAIDEGLAVPGSTLVSTDSHANLLGAIGAFGQGMGDLDIAHAFAHGSVWFKCPPTVKVTLRGAPSPAATPKDIALAILRALGASGLLGVAAEFYGPAAEALSLDGRITVASMATEMGAIIAFFPPNDEVAAHCERASGGPVQRISADPGARYASRLEVKVDGLVPLIARPGRPEDVAEVRKVEGRRIDSAFIGSCTNGRMEDLRAAAKVLAGRQVAPGVVLKIVPATDRIWRQCLSEGILATFKAAGALVGNAGCGGCAEGQIGQNGPGEVTVSTGNRNFAGKQGKGEVWLASPAVAAASAVAGAIALPDRIPMVPVAPEAPPARPAAPPAPGAVREPRPTRIRGRVWLVPRDHVDTDMIYHNRHLAVTDLSEMGRHAFGNLPEFADFPSRVKPGDILVAGENFGCGSSRQQAVDCFRALGLSLLVARSFGAIYERNAINSGFPILAADLLDSGLSDGDEIEVDLETGAVSLPGGRAAQAEPFSPVQMEIYQRGGLLS